MSGGYTPLFNTLLEGTLCGRWPHNGLWALLLSECDHRGNIDVVPHLLAAKIGVPVELLLECIADFMRPDPGSRTGDLEGRRLVLIDPANRNWGWRVVNHGIYREKARKRAYDAERTQSGKDAERKRENRLSRDVPTGPANSRRVPLSDSDSDPDSNSNSNSDTHPDTGPAQSAGQDSEAARPSGSLGPAYLDGDGHYRLPTDELIAKARAEHAGWSRRKIAEHLGIGINVVVNYDRRQDKLHGLGSRKSSWGRY
jgi:hypothetical protein